MNMAEALEVTGGDQEILVSIAQVFLEEGPMQLNAIQERIDAADACGIRNTAHLLKGSLVVFGAHRAADAAHSVEKAASDATLSEVPSAWADLREEMKLLCVELETLCGR